MRNFLVVALTLTMFSGIAVADRRGGGRGDRHDNRPTVRDHRNNQPQRAHPGRGNGRSNRPARRADRRAINRQPVLVSDGRFVFANGRTRVYRQPVIRTTYRNASVRPRLIVERYPVEPGYIWVRGSWNWAGSEWQWRGGHYAPDPRYSVYYDDGSYDYAPRGSISVGVGVGINIR